jgi:hypothetical protein
MLIGISVLDLPDPICLLPQPSGLSVQIHEIFIVIDLDDGPCTVTGPHPVPDLERFFARRLRLGGLGRGWGGAGS